MFKKYKNILNEIRLYITKILECKLARKLIYSIALILGLMSVFVFASQKTSAVTTNWNINKTFRDIVFDKDLSYNSPDFGVRQNTMYIICSDGDSDIDGLQTPLELYTASVGGKGIYADRHTVASDGGGQFNGATFTDKALSFLLEYESIYGSNYAIFYSYDIWMDNYALDFEPFYDAYRLYYFTEKAPDIIAPEVITENTAVVINIDSPISLTQLKAQFSATDNFDGNVTSRIQFTTNYPANTADVRVGDYYITGTVTDLAGNTGSGTVSLYVRDFTKPVVTLSQKTIDIEVKSTFTLTQAYAKFTVTDNYDGNITDTAKWTKGGTFTGDTNTLGSKTVIISYTDAGGNVSNTEALTINIKDTTKGTVALSQASIKVEVKTTFTLAQAYSYFTVTDNYDGNVTDTSKWTKGGTFTGNTNTLGSFTVIIGYTDTSNNVADTKTLTVNIVDEIKPLIDGDATLVSYKILTDEEIRGLYTVTDNYDGTIPSSKIVIVSNTCDGKAGTFQIVLSVTDSNGNTGTKNVVYKPTDNEVPIVWFSGGLQIPKGTQITQAHLTEFLNSNNLLNPAAISTTILGDYDKDTLGEYEVTVVEEFADGYTEITKFKLSVYQPVSYLSNSGDYTTSNTLTYILGGIVIVMVLGVAVVIKKKH